MRSTAVGLAAWSLMAATVGAAETVSGTTGVMELRRMTDRGTAPDEGGPIPAGAVRVFAYEGTPKDVRVTGRFIAVDYGRSGVLFARPSGQIAQRYTLADGWPRWKPEEFAAPRGMAAAADGRPGRVRTFSGRLPLPPSCLSPWLNHRTHPTGGWLLHSPARMCRPIHCQTRWPPRSGSPVRRGGPISRRSSFSGSSDRNISRSGAAGVPDLERSPRATQRGELRRGRSRRRGGPQAFHDGRWPGQQYRHRSGRLWRWCFGPRVSTSTTETQQWGPGGLCRYDATTGRWRRIERIDDRPVRWVTLLKTIGDELWVGFREGRGR